ncbi:MAG: DUF6000 family protein [Chitinophagales bacterium]
MEDEKLNEAIKLHSAGATVMHKSPFENLQSYQNEIEIDQLFRRKWVIPFYLKLHRNDNEWINKIVGIYQEISDEVILKNLGDFNWRTRSIGAFFAAIKDKSEFIEIIGTHLIKSEVCYAGRTYAKVLAYFNDEKGNEYLERYLEYYLKQKDLYFDQINVFRAVKYIDETNATNKIERYLNDWKEYAKGKFLYDEEDKEIETDDLRQQIETIEKIKNMATLLAT